MFLRILVVTEVIFCLNICVESKPNSIHVKVKWSCYIRGVEEARYILKSEESTARPVPSAQILCTGLYTKLRIMLFSVDEVLRIIQTSVGHGWTLEDYALIFDLMDPSPAQSSIKDLTGIFSCERTNWPRGRCSCLLSSAIHCVREMMQKILMRYTVTQLLGD